MPFASGPTTSIPDMRRLRAAVFLPSMWLPVACRRITLPLPVTRNRLVAPLCDFIFGTPSLLLSGLAHGCGLGLPFARALHL
jgi:hypothetical protein